MRRRRSSRSAKPRGVRVDDDFVLIENLPAGDAALALAAQQRASRSGIKRQRQDKGTGEGKSKSKGQRHARSKRRCLNADDSDVSLDDMDESSSEADAGPAGRRSRGAERQGRRSRSLHNDSVRTMKQAFDARRNVFLCEHWELFAPFTCAPKPSGAVSSSGIRRRRGARGSALKQEQVALDAPAPQLPSNMPPWLHSATLREYQVEGVNWLLRAHHNGIGAILGDEMGLGKTIQTICFLAHLKFGCAIGGPHLIVCPLSVLSSWVSEFKRFCPELRVAKLHSSDATERERLKRELLSTIASDFDVCVTTYDMIKSPNMKHALARVWWRYCVLDEGHVIKNAASGVSIAVRKLHCGGAVLLTGTPLQNNLRELWALLNFLLPNVFPSSSADVFDAAFDATTGARDIKQLDRAHHLLKPLMLRRVKSEVEFSLLPKVETKLYCPLSEMQVFWYQRLLLKDAHLLEQSGNADTCDNRPESWKKLKSLMMQLRKCCNHPYQFPSAERVLHSGGECGEDIVEASGKLQVLDRLLFKLKGRGHRVVLFSQFTRMLDILDDYCVLRGFQYCRLDGSTNRVQRMIQVARFNEQGSPFFLFLMSTRAGGLGINLQTADTCILFDSDWNPQVDIQAMGRVHRIGQKKLVHVYRMVTAGSVEERILQRSEKKLLLDRAVNRGNSAVAQTRDSKAAASTEDDISDLDKNELIASVIFGAANILDTRHGTGTAIGMPTDDDLDELIERKAGSSDTSHGAGHANANSSHELQRSSSKFARDEVRPEFSIREFRGRNYGHDKMKAPSTVVGIAEQWREMQGAKRSRSKRTIDIDGHTVLKQNNYSLEDGEPSVLDSELARARDDDASASTFEIRVGRQVAGRDYENQGFCQSCWEGGALVCCDFCPAAYCEDCLRQLDIDTSNNTSQWACPHHRCDKCSRSGAAAGGMLFRCEVCPHAYCEDCLPHDVKLTYECKRYNALGYQSVGQACYVICDSSCKEFAERKDVTQLMREDEQSKGGTGQRTTWQKLSTHVRRALWRASLARRVKEEALGELNKARARKIIFDNWLQSADFKSVTESVLRATIETQRQAVLVNKTHATQRAQLALETLHKEAAKLDDKSFLKQHLYYVDTTNTCDDTQHAGGSSNENFVTVRVVLNSDRKLGVTLCQRLRPPLANTYKLPAGSLEAAVCIADTTNVADTLGGQLLVGDEIVGVNETWIAALPFDAVVDALSNAIAREQDTIFITVLRGGASYACKASIQSGCVTAYNVECKDNMKSQMERLVAAKNLTARCMRKAAACASRSAAQVAICAVFHAKLMLKEADRAVARLTPRWHRSGHAWIGLPITRFFGALVPVVGRIDAWLPPEGEDATLWHVVYTDGDEEDLNEQEVRDGLAGIHGRHRLFRVGQEIIYRTSSGRFSGMIATVRAASLIVEPDDEVHMDKVLKIEGVDVTKYDPRTQQQTMSAHGMQKMESHTTNLPKSDRIGSKRSRKQTKFFEAGQGEGRAYTMRTQPRHQCALACAVRGPHTVHVKKKVVRGTKKLGISLEIDSKMGVFIISGVGTPRYVSASQAQTSIMQIGDVLYSVDGQAIAGRKVSWVVAKLKATAAIVALHIIPRAYYNATAAVYQAFEESSKMLCEANDKISALRSEIKQLQRETGKQPSAASTTFACAFFSRADITSEGQVRNVVRNVQFDSRSFDLAVNGQIPSTGSNELAAFSRSGLQSRTTRREEVEIMWVRCRYEEWVRNTEAGFRNLECCQTLETGERAKSNAQLHELLVDRFRAECDRHLCSNACDTKAGANVNTDVANIGLTARCSAHAPLVATGMCWAAQSLRNAHLHTSVLSELFRALSSLQQKFSTEDDIASTSPNLPTARAELESAILAWKGMPLPPSTSPLPAGDDLQRMLQDDTEWMTVGDHDSALASAAEHFLYLLRFLEGRSKAENLNLARALGVQIYRPKLSVTRNSYGESIRVEHGAPDDPEYLMSLSDATSVTRAMLTEHLCFLLLWPEQQHRILTHKPCMDDTIEWKRDGCPHGWLGRLVRREFYRKGVGMCVAFGKITGWVPAEGDDVALWHVVHEDGDEEDLEEHEVRDEIADDQLWLTDGCPNGWIERDLCRRFGAKIVVGSIVGWLPATPEDPALWRVRHHEDNDEEDLEEDEVRDALELWSELLMQQKLPAPTLDTQIKKVCAIGPAPQRQYGFNTVAVDLQALQAQPTAALNVERDPECLTWPAIKLKLREQAERFGLPQAYTSNEVLPDDTSKDDGDVNTSSNSGNGVKSCSLDEPCTAAAGLSKKKAKQDADSESSGDDEEDDDESSDAHRDEAARADTAAIADGIMTQFDADEGAWYVVHGNTRVAGPYDLHGGAANAAATMAVAK